MATITWPATLPAPLQGSYRESPPDNLIRSNMDTGPAKVRRRSTAAPRPISVAYHLTAAEIETFDEFYVETAVGGSLPFNWTHPRTGAACVARFVSPPEYSSVSNEGEVSASLEVLP